MSTIGLIAAMSQESRALLGRVPGWKRITISRLPAYTFSIASRSCILVTSGMGSRRAAEAARWLVENAHPLAIVSFGIAGAVEADLEIGDVILPGSCYPWDGTTFGERIPLAVWPQAVVEMAAQSLRPGGRRVFEGTAVTTAGSQAGQEQMKDIAHPVLEMETAGIAQVAAENATPLYSLRAISDGPRAPIPLNLASVMDQDANLRVGKLLESVIHRPGIIFQSRRILQNNAVAASCAAMALVAILSLADFPEVQ